MTKTQYIFVNGILNNPEDVEAWTDRAVVWINQNTDSKADKMEYECGIFTRRIFQETRVKNLQKIAKNYDGGRIVLIGHSNGCDIIQRLVQKGIPRVHELHLIAAAAEGCFNRNGYNKALKNEKIDRIFVYTSPIDSALKQAKLSTQLFGWMGLGYGYLGLSGPLNVDPINVNKITVYNERLDHSQWFSKKYFERTMKHISGV